MQDADAVIVGAGAAGLSLAYRLCEPAAGAPRLRVLLVDAPRGPLTPQERTWCYWEAPGGPFDSALTASWERLRVHGPDGAATQGRPAPFQYKMLRSRDFEALVGTRLSGQDTVVRVGATVESVRDVAGGAEVRGRDEAGRPVALRARWAFDSRPPVRLPPPAPRSNSTSGAGSSTAAWAACSTPRPRISWTSAPRSPHRACPSDMSCR